MYFIIETLDQLSKLTSSESCFVQVIPSSNRWHPALSRCSLVYYNAGDKGYIFPINHSEGFSLQISKVQSFLDLHKKVYLFDRKAHSYFIDVKSSVDLNFIRVDQGMDESKFDCLTRVHRSFDIKQGDYRYINEIIPITKHYETCECLYDKALLLIDLESEQHFLDRASDAYSWVEKQGIGVDEDRLVALYGVEKPEYFIDRDVVYSQYNMYNITGRPTNSFNSVNFVAIPKTKEFRRCFVPKYDFLVEFDFDAYHLRLISKQIGYELPDQDQSIHTQLGRMYFGKEELTEEEYHASKEITFKQLYGGIEAKYRTIPLFSKIGDFIEHSWTKYKKEGSIKLPTGTMLKRDPEMNKLKLFNYWVQNLETKINTEKIERLREYMVDCKSKLVLITYDSFLFDYCVEDGKDFLIKIKEILQEGGFKVKHKHSKDYFFD